ncbi:DUF262 domain-containing protein [Leptospira bandrabouensis]|uniref:DUF262 domain-containing protein n=1 Tax=Leptospira bandrabouensis TaxID=2484903 RepID=UPI001EE91F19|nr:DUF262 domain-containing protein [Leptospira bandrabouensis]MCG6146609.1 DUF262 domain-containing protein [Leptospira bandrabouensis]MCG6162010.1 DUF262 domain-containing protein [Leptospira bandrabouensis]MCG6166220.1 DUF262 domain-containing protein [Leptospira bandrabouensis]
MKTTSSNKKIRELIGMLKSGNLIPRPEFQRRLIWTSKDKNHFLDTVLKGYPFPEIYFADGEIDTETGNGTQLLVDGQQRISTLIQYFEDSPELKLQYIPPYKTLSEDDRKKFLNYDVSVRDLGLISKQEIIEVFKRINATKYSLEDIEINNAVYSGALKKFAENLSNHPIFLTHPIFSPLDYKRMGNLRFCLSIIATLLVGYYNRDDEFEKILSEYNDFFPDEEEINDRLEKVFSFIEECGFENSSRIWKKADFFTFTIELDKVLNLDKIKIEPIDCLNLIEGFFQTWLSTESKQLFEIYSKATIQATNDKANRIRRSIIIGGILTKEHPQSIIENLQTMHLLK